jgi:tetratricopeptide (TPR) repeat protein
VAVLRKVSDDAPRSIRELNPDIPEWLAAIIGKLMVKDATARYQSAAEVAELFAHHLARLQRTATIGPAESAAAAALEKPRRRARPQVVLLGAIILLAGGLGAILAMHSLNPGPSSAKSTPLPPNPPGPALDASLAPAKPPSPPVPFASAGSPVAPAAVTPESAKKAKEFIATGAEAARRREIQKAIADYTEAGRLDPTSVKALLARARLYSGPGASNLPAAIADATEVIRLDPKNADAYAIRAGNLYMTRDYRRAIEDATAAIRLDPKQDSAYGTRGAAYKELGEWKHAIVDLNEAISRAPNSSWPFLHRAFAYGAMGEKERALADINRAIEINPNVNHFWIFRAQLFAEKKDYDRARAEFGEAIRVSSDSEKYFAYQRRGDFEMSLCLFDPAIADYSETIRRNTRMTETKDVSGYVARARAYLVRGETDRALADCEAALRIEAKTLFVHSYRGYANARKGRWDRALAEFDEEARRQPEAKLKFLTCQAGALALAGRFEQAVASFDRARKADEGFARGTLSSRAFYLDRLRGDYEEAINNLNRAEHPVWPPNVFLYRGIIYARLGQPDLALADFKKLMDIVNASRPDFFAVDDFVCRRLVFLLGRAEACLAKGDLEHALTDSDEAVGFAPSSAEARLLRARVHDKRGKPDLAEADRRAAAKLVPDLMVAPLIPTTTGLDKGR